MIRIFILKLQASGTEGTFSVPLLLLPVHAQVQPQDAHRASAQRRIGQAQQKARNQKGLHTVGTSASLISCGKCSAGPR